ncbi:Glycogen phosphorylase [Pseudomonas chlororaphis]
MKSSKRKPTLNFLLNQESSMSTQAYRAFADIGLTPIGSLENTATVLGDILGITFKEDNEGTYDEYPAFLASTPTLKYALLGTPLPEDDLREEPSNEFNLLVSSIDDSSDLPEIDISEKLISQLMKSAVVQCWRLN